MDNYLKGKGQSLLHQVECHAAYILFLAVLITELYLFFLTGVAVTQSPATCPTAPATSPDMPTQGSSNTAAILGGIIAAFTIVIIIFVVIVIVLIVLLR